MAIVENKRIVSLGKNEIFVFGSNLLGAHGAGAAAFAADRFGAVEGVGEGLTGFSYAFPTVGKNLEPLPPSQIALSFERLRECATENHMFSFYLTKVGSGYASYKGEEIRDFAFVSRLPANVYPWWVWEDTQGEFDRKIEVASVEDVTEYLGQYWDVEDSTGWRVDNGEFHIVSSVDLIEKCYNARDPMWMFHIDDLNIQTALRWNWSQFPKCL